MKRTTSTSTAISVSPLWRLRPRRRHRRRLWTLLAAPVLALLMAASLAPAPAAGAAEEETHTLTVKVLDHNGKAPCPGCVEYPIRIFHDTWDDTGLGELHYLIPRDDIVDDGMGSVEVPPGVYTIIGRLRNAPYADFTSWYYMVEVEVPVEADTTVVLDAREAVLMKPPTVPETGAQVRDHTFLLSKEHAIGTDDTWFDWRAPIDGTNDATRRAADVYVTPFPEPTLTRIVMMDRWILAEPHQMRPDPFDSDSTQLYSDTPAYMYHVPRVYTAGFDPNTLNNAYTAAEFTTVPTHYHSDYEDALIATIPMARTTQMASGSGTVVMFRPGEVLQHYLASDEVLWSNADWIYRGEDAPHAPRIVAHTREAFPLAEAGTVQPSQDRHSGPVRVAVSETDGPYTDLWNSDPRADPAMTPDLPPNFYRGGEHNERFALTSCLNDNAGGIRFYDECKATGTWSLKNLDTGLPLPPDPATVFATVFTGLPAKKTTYRLEHRIDVVPEAIKARYRTQPAQHTEWTFTSAASDAQLSENFTLCAEMPNYGTDRTCQLQPLLQLRYLLDLNTWNRAPAGQRHAIQIETGYLPEAVHAPGAGDSLIGPKDLTMTVQATFDDGATWQPVDLKRQGRMFRAVVDHPALGATSGFVGLRVTATDTTTGATVKQVHHRAYMLE